MRLVVPLLLLTTTVASAAPPVVVDQAPTPRHWSLLVEGGMLVPFPSNSQTLRGTVGLAASRLLLDQRLELELGLRLGLSHISTDIAASARAGFRFSLGPLQLTPGARLGYVAIRVSKGALGTLWTGALLINPGLDLSLGLTRYLELRARLLSVSAYYNDQWVLSWEPSMGAGWRF
jgi:hypothetical protein